MNKEHQRVLCMVVSSPSGGGKTTLCRKLLTEFPRITYSISCTTRPARSGEIDGKDYFFMDNNEFIRRVKSDEFLEHAEVHGYWYGTRREDVEKTLAAGKDILMDIDVQGADSIRKISFASPGTLLHDAFVDIFISPPDMIVLEQRLRARGQDADDVILRRLQNAEREMKHMGEYRHVVVNDKLDEAYERLRSIVIAEYRGNISL